MKKFLLLYALAVTLSLAGVLRRYRTETHRLEQNQRALLSQVERYRTRAGEAAASAEVLQLRCREFERLRAGDAERIRQLGIRLRRVEAAATLATATEIDVQVPLHDTIARRDFAAVCDSGRLAAAEAYAVQSIPSNFLIRCSDGQIVAAQLRGKALGEKLEELLGK